MEDSNHTAMFLLYVQKMPELEKRLISSNTGDENAVKSAIEEFSEQIQLEGDSILNKYHLSP